MYLVRLNIFKAYLSIISKYILMAFKGATSSSMRFENIG